MAQPSDRRPGAPTESHRARPARVWFALAILLVSATGLWWAFGSRSRQSEQPARAATRLMSGTDPAARSPVDFSPPEVPAPRAPSSEEARFVKQLMSSEVRSDLGGVELDPATLALLAQGDIAQAARELERRAAAGDAAANVVLSLLQECSGADSEFLLQLQGNEWRSAARDLPPERRARIELAVEARRSAAQAAARSCGKADFQRTAIAERLEGAAAAGHEASLRRLGEETTDVEARVKLWTSAAMLGHVQAQLDLAQHYRRDYLGTQRNGGRMKFWMDVSARNSSAGKLLLAECQLNGCNGQPPHGEMSARLLREAAQAGDLEAIEKLTGPDGAAASTEERAAWSEFRDRLNEAGCYGASEYPRVSIGSWRLSEDNRAVSPYLQEQEKQLAERYWSEHGATARRALQCE